MDTQNPAVQKHLAMAPALVEAIHDDPAAAAPAARVMAMVLLHEEFCTRGDKTPAQRLDLAEKLTKIGKIDGKQAEVAQHAGSGYQLVINFGNAKQETFSGVTVEATNNPQIAHAETTDASV